MKGLKLMAMIALATTLTGCQMGDKTLSSGIDLANLDTTFLPGTDFYEFATHGWQVANPLTAEYSRYGSFDVLQENNNKQLRELIDSVAAQKNEPGSVAQKIADLYNSAMDSVNLNEHWWGAFEEFMLCDGYQNSPEITQNWLRDVWPRMQRQGVPPRLRHRVRFLRPNTIKTHFGVESRRRTVYGRTGKRHDGL